MALEKKRVLRRVELTFTDGKLHPECHCVYQDQVLEDGEIIMANNHRETDDAAKYVAELPQKEMYVQPVRELQ